RRLSDHSVNTTVAGGGRQVCRWFDLHARSSDTEFQRGSRVASVYRPSGSGWFRPTGDWRERGQIDEKRQKTGQCRVLGHSNGSDRFLLFSSETASVGAR